MKVNSNKRPTCGDILNNPLVKKRIEFFNSMKSEENDGDLLSIDDRDEQALLKTIRIPKNLLFLPNQLPKPNYNKSRTKLDAGIVSKIHHRNQTNIRARLPKLNLNTKQTEETKSQNFLSIACEFTKQNSIIKEKEENNNDIINNINSINYNNFDIKNEVQFYKKLHMINKKMYNPIQRIRSLDKNSPYDYNSININSNSNSSRLDYNLKNNLNNNISNKYKKLYKLYEPNKNQNEIKKMPKYKILNGLRNNNNKYNMYLKNREELYKDLYKKVGVQSELMQMRPRDKITIIDNSEANSDIFSQLKIDNEFKIYKNKNKLSPITINKRDSSDM